MHKSANMLFSITVFPIGSGEDISAPVSDVIAKIADSGLPYQVTGSSTLVEGKWTEVMPIIEKCVHDLTKEHSRVYANIDIDFHGGAGGRLKTSVEAVEQELDRELQKRP